MKKTEQPTNREVEIECAQCKTMSKHFMTNQEIFTRTEIKQLCKTCQEVRIHRLR